MWKKPLDLSEQSFLGATLIVGSAVGSIIGVSALFWQSPLILVSIGAGAAWALCIALLVMNGWLRRRVTALESELASERERLNGELASERERLNTDLSVERARVDQFSRTADNVSQSVLTVLRMTPETPPPPRRRRTAQAVPAQPQQGD